MTVEEIKSPDGQVLAIFLTPGLPEPGRKFFTRPHESLQAGLIRLVPNEVISPHRHRSRCNPQLVETQEMLVVTRGSIWVRVFCWGEMVYSNWFQVAERTLEVGDAVVFLRGGHSVGAIGDDGAEFWEAKTGPWMGPEDKEMLQ